MFNEWLGLLLREDCHWDKAVGAVGLAVVHHKAVGAVGVVGLVVVHHEAVGQVGVIGVTVVQHEAVGLAIIGLNAVVLNTFAM